MEQITLEEVIRALSFFRSAIQSGEEWSPDCDALYEHITTALQAAEPEMVVDIRRDPRDGSPSPRILKFSDLGDGEHQLFTLPCPPSKAQVPEGWRDELTKIRDVIAAAPIDALGTGEAAECAPWPIRDEVVDGLTRLLTASPAPACQCRTESDEKFGTLIHQCEACESNQVTGRRRKQEEAER